MTQPSNMKVIEALQFFRAMKILPKEQDIVSFDFSATPVAADIVYYIPDDEQVYGGDLTLGPEQQVMILKFFGVGSLNVTCINVCTHDQEVFVDVTIMPESRK